jgi:hypothetical protein
VFAVPEDWPHVRDFSLGISKCILCKCSIHTSSLLKCAVMCYSIISLNFSVWNSYQNEPEMGMEICRL